MALMVLFLSRVIQSLLTVGSTSKHVKQCFIHFEVITYYKFLCSVTRRVILTKEPFGSNAAVQRVSE